MDSGSIKQSPVRLARDFLMILALDSISLRAPFTILEGSVVLGRFFAVCEYHVHEGTKILL